MRLRKYKGILLLILIISILFFDILKKPDIYQDAYDKEVLRTELRHIDSEILASLDKIYGYERKIKFLDPDYQMPFLSQPDFRAR
jgi:hypothetical protein